MINEPVFVSKAVNRYVQLGSISPKLKPLGRIEKSAKLCSPYSDSSIAVDEVLIIRFAGLSILSEKSKKRRQLFDK